MSLSLRIFGFCRLTYVMLRCDILDGAGAISTAEKPGARTGLWGRRWNRDEAEKRMNGKILAEFDIKVDHRPCYFGCTISAKLSEKKMQKIENFLVFCDRKETIKVKCTLWNIKIKSMFHKMYNMRSYTELIFLTFLIFYCFLRGDSRNREKCDSSFKCIILSVVSLWLNMHWWWTQWIFFWIHIGKKSTFNIFAFRVYVNVKRRATRASRLVGSGRGQICYIWSIPGQDSNSKPQGQRVKRLRIHY